MDLEPKIYRSSTSGKSTRANNSDCDCDCDCACSYDVLEILENNLNSNVFMQSKVRRLYLTADYQVLFNPTMGRDVVVVNDIAYDIWNSFQKPMVLELLPSPDYEIAVKMIQTGLLESEKDALTACNPVRETLSVWLHITNNCNLRCTYCYVNKTNDHMSLETGMAAIDAAFRSALAGGFRKVTLKFAGGEPTLRLDTVFQLHAYGLQVAARKEIELDAVILSNGVNLSQENMDAIQARGLRLMLSIDGLGIAHDAQRPFLGGQGSYEKVWKALERALHSGLRPFISITVTDESVQDLPNLISQLLPMGLPFNLNFARPVVSGKLPDNQKMIAGLRETFRVIEANLPEYSLLGGVLDRSFFSTAHEQPCGVGESYLVVDHRGQVASCQMSLGQSVTDIYADDPLLALKVLGSVKNPPVDEKEGCSQCEWKYMCAGGCPLTAYQATGRYDVASPFCEVYKVMYPELLRLEGLRILKYSGALEEIA